MFLAVAVLLALYGKPYLRAVRDAHGTFSGQGLGCLQTVVLTDCYIHLLPAGIGALVNSSLVGIQ
jgi:hypothetical protein